MNESNTVRKDSLFLEVIMGPDMFLLGEIEEGDLLVST